MEVIERIAKAAANELNAALKAFDKDDPDLASIYVGSARDLVEHLLREVDYINYRRQTD